MHRMNLRGVDLNLLVVLKALLEERNTTKAAERLAMSQPAVSRALARLRLLYDDPLLIRTPQGMEPTARAEALLLPLREILHDIEQTFSPPSSSTPPSSRGCCASGPTPMWST
ncbi:LysR family transcriptional regulator [Aeromonas hydrophila]|nr:LysR family transcriptional regulator [Aeromonas hydrophila]